MSIWLSEKGYSLLSSTVAFGADEFCDSAVFEEGGCAASDVFSFAFLSSTASWLESELSFTSSFFAFSSFALEFLSSCLGNSQEFTDSFFLSPVVQKSKGL